MGRGDGLFFLLEEQSTRLLAMLIRRHGNGLPAGGLERLEAVGGEIRDILSRDDTRRDAHYCSQAPPRIVHSLSLSL